MEPRKITHIGRKWVRIEREDWARFIQMAFTPDVVRSTNGCDGFCNFACEDHGGCLASFGEEPECGAICDDLEVFVQQP